MARRPDFSELREKTKAQATPSSAQAFDPLAEFLDKRVKDNSETAAATKAPPLLDEFLKKRAEETSEQVRQEAMHLQTMDDLRRDKSRSRNSRVAGLTFASFDEFDSEPGDDEDDNSSALEFLTHSKHHRPGAAENFVSRSYHMAQHQFWHGVAILKNAAHNVKAAAEHAIHPGAAHPSKLRLRDHAGSAAFVAGSAASDLLAAGFRGYLEARVGGLAQGGHMGSRDDAYAGAGKAVVAGAGGAVIGAALTFIPGYTSYQEAKQGNWGSALLWGAVDVMGAAAFVLTLGTAGSVVEGAVFAAKAARVGKVVNVAFKAENVQRSARIVEAGAKGVNRLNLAYNGVNMAVAANHFREYLDTEHGRLMLKAMKEEALEKGITPKTLKEFARAEMKAKGMPEQFADMAVSRMQDDKLSPLPTARGPSFAALKDAKVDQSLKAKSVVEGASVLMPIA